jgi:hypothetical protein
MSCRHCSPRPMVSSYASVAFLGKKTLEDAVQELEGVGIVPCVNAVCGTCGRLSVILYDVQEPYLHSLVLFKVLKSYLV